MLLLSLWLHYSINHDLLVPHRLLHHPREYIIPPNRIYNSSTDSQKIKKKNTYWKWEDKIVFASSARSNNHLWTIYRKKKEKKGREKRSVIFFSNKRYSSFPSLCFRKRHPSFYFRNHIRARDSSPSVRIYNKACSVIYLEQPCLEYEIGRGRKRAYHRRLCVHAVSIFC